MTAVDGLTCGHRHHRGHVQAADADDSDRKRAATQNTTDLRRARQHARRVFRDLSDDITLFLEEQGVYRIDTSDRVERRINEQITQLAAQKLQDDLVAWLEERRKQTWGRAVRASLDAMQTTVNGAVTRTVTRRDFVGVQPFSPTDHALNRAVSQIDAGLLYDKDGSLADEVGNRVTRQVRLGVQLNEGIKDIGDRVDFVLHKGDAPERREKGVTGQTVRTKGELIAHDSIQHGYTTAATHRYLRNGFRFVTYDAVNDLKTTDLCTRLDEHVIDLTKTPWLVPPNHPWCFDPLTEVLTEGGFKRFADLDGTERLFTLDDDRRIHVERPEAYIQRQFTGNLLHIQTNDFDVAVTPNHKFPYYSDWKYKNHDSPTLEHKRADELSGGDKIPRTGKWAVQSPDTVTVAGDDYDAVGFMLFMGWFLSEGSAFMDDGNARVTITQHDTDTLDSLQNHCQDLFACNVWKGQEKIGFSNDVAKWLVTLGHSHEKFVPERLKRLGQEPLRACLDAYLRGDGHERAGGTDDPDARWNYDFNSERVYYTSSPQLADDIGELILKCGNRPSFKYPNDNRQGREVAHANGVYRTNHPVIAVRECRNQHYAHKKERERWVDYSGPVYCVTMPTNPVIYVRRNGKCTWAGNCRSGIRPKLSADGVKVLSQDDISSDYLQTIMATKSFRPSVLSPERELRPNGLVRGAV